MTEAGGSFEFGGASLVFLRVAVWRQYSRNLMPEWIALAWRLVLIRIALNSKVYW